MPKRQPPPPLDEAKRRKPLAAARDESVLGSFSQLSDVDDAVRHAAALRIAGLVSPPDKQVDREYALKRLTRGLASNRPLARQGFALCLVGVLRACNAVETARVLDLIDEATAVGSHDKGDEERDKHLGRAFGYLAVIRAGRASNACAPRLAKGLCDLAGKKSWLREFASGALVCLCQALTDAPTGDLAQALETFCAFAPGTLELSPGAALDAEQLAVAVTAQRQWAAKPKWAVHRKRLGALVAPLATAWRSDPPRLCLVWQVLVDAALDADVLAELFNAVVAESLLKGAQTSQQRKAAALLVVAYAASRVADVRRPELIAGAVLQDDAVVAALASLAAAKSKALADPARSAFESIAAALDASRGMEQAWQDARLRALRRLRGPGVDESKAGNQTSVKLLAGLDGDALSAYVAEHEADLSAPAHVAALVEVARVHGPRALRTCESLFRFGFLPERADAGEACRSRFTASLSAALAHSRAAVDVLRAVHAWWKADDAAGKRARKAAKRLAKAGTAEAGAMEALLLLVALLGFVDELPGAGELLDDLELAADKLLARTGGGGGGGEEGAVDAVAVVTDAMLALLAQPSALVRQVVGEAAMALGPRVAASPEAVELVCAALARQADGVAAGAAAEEDDDESGGDVEDEANGHSPLGDGADDVDDVDDGDDGDDDEGAVAEEEPTAEQPSDNDDDAYDAALMAMVDLRSETSAKARRKAKKQAQRELVSFKLRVLDVLEAVVKAAPALAPRFVPALLSAAQQSAAGLDGGVAGELVGRARSVAQRLFRRTGDTVETANAAAIVTQAVALARASKHKPVAQLAMDAAAYGARLCGAGAELDAHAIVAPMVRDVIQGRGSAVSAASLAALLEAAPALARAAVPLVCEAVPRTPFQQGAALTLLGALVKAPGVDAAALLGAIEAAAVGDDAEAPARAKGGAQRQRDALKVLAAWRRQFGALPEGTRAAVRRVAGEAQSAAVKQLAAQCLAE